MAIIIILSPRVDGARVPAGRPLQTAPPTSHLSFLAAMSGARNPDSIFFFRCFCLSLFRLHRPAQIKKTKTAPGPLCPPVSRVRPRSRKSAFAPSPSEPLVAPMPLARRFGGGCAVPRSRPCARIEAHVAVSGDRMRFATGTACPPPWNDWTRRGIARRDEGCDGWLASPFRPRWPWGLVWPPGLTVDDRPVKV